MKAQRTLFSFFFGGGGGERVGVALRFVSQGPFWSEMGAVYTNISCLSFDLIDSLRAYLTQLRQELGQRIVEAVFDPKTDKPSKVLDSICKMIFLTIFDLPVKCIGNQVTGPMVI